MKGIVVVGGYSSELHDVADRIEPAGAASLIAAVPAGGVMGPIRLRGTI